jgi:hypothetical protein
VGLAPLAAWPNEIWCRRLLVIRRAGASWVCTAGFAILAQPVKASKPPPQPRLWPRNQHGGLPPIISVAAMEPTAAPSRLTRIKLRTNPARGDGPLIPPACKRPVREQRAAMVLDRMRAPATGKRLRPPWPSQVRSRPHPSYAHHMCEHCGGNIPGCSGVGKARKETKGCLVWGRFDAE